jgi:large subunit ribosomal protein L21
MSKYAIIEFQGKQYKVSENTIFDTSNYNDIEEGKSLEIDTVLLVNDKGTLVGKPYVKGAKVKLQLMQNHKGAKIDVFKYKAKKRYQRSMGHRSLLSQFKVESITVEA